MKINNEIVWGLGGLFLGYLLFKRAETHFTDVI